LTACLPQAGINRIYRITLKLFKFLKSFKNPAYPARIIFNNYAKVLVIFAFAATWV